MGKKNRGAAPPTLREGDNVVLAGNSKHAGKTARVDRCFGKLCNLRLANGFVLKGFPSKDVQPAGGTRHMNTSQRFYPGEWVALSESHRPANYPSHAHARVVSHDGDKASVAIYDTGVEVVFEVPASAIEPLWKGPSSPSSKKGGYIYVGDVVEVDADAVPNDAISSIGNVVSLIHNQTKVQVEFSTKFGSLHVAVEESKCRVIANDSGPSKPSLPSKSSYPSYKKTEVEIEVVGESSRWTTDLYEDELERALENIDYKVEKDDKGKDVYVFVLAQDQAKYTYRTKNVQCCAFDATEKFLKHWLGRELDSDDRDWYKNHPNTVANGLPFGCTITVLSDLVRPYGVGIKKVWMRKSTSAFEETIAWQKTLGINPEAELQRNVTNAEFLELMGPAAEFIGEGPEDWGFEYADQLPNDQPYIAMCGLSSSTSFAGGMGHSEYYGPRRKADNWQLAIQFDRIENCRYKAPPPTIEYAYSGERVLVWGSSKDKNGKPISTSVTRQAPSYSKGGYSGLGSSNYSGGKGSSFTTAGQGGPTLENPATETSKTQPGETTSSSSTDTPTTIPDFTDSEGSSLALGLYAQEDWVDKTDSPFKLTLADLAEDKWQGLLAYLQDKRLLDAVLADPTELHYDPLALVLPYEDVGAAVEKVKQAVQADQAAAAWSDRLLFKWEDGLFLFLTDEAPELADTWDQLLTQLIDSIAAKVSAIESYALACTFLNSANPLKRAVGVDLYESLL